MINLENARNKGYSDEDILVVLKKKMPEIDFDKAMGSVEGITIDEVVNVINKRGVTKPTTQVDDISEKLYSAFEQAETGPYEDKWIRTNVSEGPVSTAYGPVQITSGLAKRYKENVPELFDQDEIDYLDRFNIQGGKFLTNTEGQYGFGGSGELTSEQDKEMYKRVAKKMMKHHYDQTGGDLEKTWKLWRFGPEGGEDDRYKEEFTKAIEGYTPVAPKAEPQAPKMVLTPADIKELRLERAAQEGGLLDPAKVFFTSLADITGNTFQGLTTKDATNEADEFFGPIIKKYDSNISKGMDENEAFKKATKGYVMSSGTIDELKANYEKQKVEEQELLSKSLNEARSLNEKIKAMVPDDWRSRSEKLVSGKIAGVDEGVFDDGVLNGLKETVSTFVYNAISNYPRNLRALPVALLKKKPGLAAGAAALGLAATTSEMESSNLNEVTDMLDNANIDYDINDVKNIVEKQSMLQAAMEYTDDVSEMVIATGIGSGFAKTAVGGKASEFFKKQAKKAVIKLFAQGVLEGATEVGQAYLGDYYNGVIAKETGMSKDEAEDFVSTLSEPKAKAFVLGFGTSLITTGGTSAISGVAAKSKAMKDIEAKAQQISNDQVTSEVFSQETEEEKLDKAIATEIEKITEIVEQEPVDADDIQTEADAEAVLTNILSDETISPEARERATEAMTILKEEIKPTDQGEQRAEVEKEIEPTQTIPEAEKAQEEVSKEVSEKPSPKEMFEGADRETRLEADIVGADTEEYIAQADTDAENEAKAMENIREKESAGEELTDFEKQTKEMIYHREHLENLEGRRVTEADAMKDWVSRKPNEKESLAEMYRDRHERDALIKTEEKKEEKDPSLEKEKEREKSLSPHTPLSKEREKEKELPSLKEKKQKEEKTFIREGKAKAKPKVSSKQRSERVFEARDIKVPVKRKTGRYRDVSRPKTKAGNQIRQQLKKSPVMADTMGGFVDNMAYFVTEMSEYSKLSKKDTLSAKEQTRFDELGKTLMREDVETLLELRNNEAKSTKRIQDLESKAKLTVDEKIELSGLKDDSAELARLEKEIPFHLKGEVRDIRTSDKRGQNKFLKQSPQEVRDWLVNTMNAPEIVVSDLTDDQVKVIQTAVGRYYGTQGLALTKKGLKKVSKTKAQELIGEGPERARSKEKLDKLDRVKDKDMPYDNKDKDHVKWVVNGVAEIDDEGNLVPGPGFNRTEKRLQVGTAMSEEITDPDIKDVAIENITGEPEFEGEVKDADWYLDPENYQGWSVLDIRSTESKDVEYLKEVDSSRLSKSENVKARSVATPAMMSVLEYIRRNEKQRKNVTRVIDNVYKSIETDGTIPVELIRQIPMAADNVDVAGIPSTQLKGLVNSVFKLESEIESKFGRTKLDSDADVRADIEKMYDDGKMSLGAKEQMLAILDAMGFDPTVLLKQGRKSFYDISTRVINLKQVEDFSHEASHWAYFNLLTPKERRDYKLKVLSKYQTKGVVPALDVLKMRDTIRREDVTNAVDNFSEFFAEQSGEMINNGEYSATDTWFDKVKSWFKRLWDSLKGSSYTDPFVREYWNTITLSGAQLKKLQQQRRVQGKTKLSAADIFQNGTFDGVQFDMQGADFLKDFTKFEIKEATTVSEKFQDTIKGAMLARDMEKAKAGELSVHDAQALFLDYAIRMIPKNDVRKNLFRTVIKIEKVGDKYWNHALEVTGNIMERRQRNEKVRAIQASYKKLRKRDLEATTKEQYDEAIEGVGMTKLTEKTMMKLRDLELQLSAIDEEDMTPTQRQRLSEARERLEANPLANMSIDELKALDEKLKAIIMEDISIKKERVALGKARKEKIEEEAKNTAAKFKQTGVEKILSTFEKATKNEKLQNVFIEMRKANKATPLELFNVENTVEMMGEAGEAINEFVIQPVIQGKEKSTEWFYDSIDSFQEVLKKSKLDINNWSSVQYGLVSGVVSEKKIKRHTVRVPSTGKELTMSYDEYANFLRTARDPDGFNTLIDGGMVREQKRTIKDEWKFTPDDVIAIMKEAPEDVVKYAFEVGDAWFNGTEKEKLNELGREYTGHDIATEGDDYTHLKKAGQFAYVDETEYASISELVNRNAHISPKQGSMKARTTDTKVPISIEGMTESVIRSAHDHGVYAGFGKTYSQVEAAMSEFANELNKVGGEAIADKLSKKIASEMTSGTEKYSVAGKKLSGLRTAYTIGKLGLRLSSAIVQNTSILLYPTIVEDANTRHKVIAKIPEATAKVWAKAVKAKFNVNEAFGEMVQNSPLMRKRLEEGFAIDLTQAGASADVKRFIAEATGDRNRTEKLFRKLSPEQAMGMIQFFDAMAMAQGWELAKEQIKMEKGLSKGDEGYWEAVREVHNEFSRKTQPTSDTFDRSGLQDAPGIKHLMMFASFRSKLWQVIGKAGSEIKSGKKPLKGLETIGYVVLLQVMTDLLKQGVKKAEGKDVPEDKEEFATLTLNNLMGSFPLAGELLTGLIMPLIDEDHKHYGDETYIADIVNNIVDLANAVRDEDEEKRNKALIKLSAALKIPVEGLMGWVNIINNIRSEED